MEQYIVADTDIGGGLPPCSPVLPTLEAALARRRTKVEAHAADHKCSLEESDQVLDGTIIFKILPPDAEIPQPEWADDRYIPWRVDLSGDHPVVGDNGLILLEVANQIDGKLWGEEVQQ